MHTFINKYIKYVKNKKKYDFRGVEKQQIRSERTRDRQRVSKEK